jgi:hypothetical protein
MVPQKQAEGKRELSALTSFAISNARALLLKCAAREDSSRKLELAIFAVWQLAKMTQEFKESYYRRYHGEKQDAS